MRMRSAHRGFTLLELIIALVLLGLLSGVLFGSVKLAGRSTDSGEAKAEAAASMRLAQEFLRTNLEAQHPLRMRKIVDWPLLFVGASDELRYASELPPRVAGGGIWFYRLAVRADDARSPLVLERMIPDLTADAPPEFVNADRSVLRTALPHSSSAISDATGCRAERRTFMARPMDRHAASASADPRGRIAEAGRSMANTLRRAARGARSGMPRVGSRATTMRGGQSMRRSAPASPASRSCSRCG